MGYPNWKKQATNYKFPGSVDLWIYEIWNSEFQISGYSDLWISRSTCKRQRKAKCRKLPSDLQIYQAAMSSRNKVLCKINEVEHAYDWQEKLNSQCSWIPQIFPILWVSELLDLFRVTWYANSVFAIGPRFLCALWLNVEWKMPFPPTTMFQRESELGNRKIRFLDKNKTSICCFSGRVRTFTIQTIWAW